MINTQIQSCLKIDCRSTQKTTNIRFNYNRPIMSIKADLHVCSKPHAKLHYWSRSRAYKTATFWGGCLLRLRPRAFKRGRTIPYVCVRVATIGEQLNSTRCGTTRSTGWLLLLLVARALPSSTLTHTKHLLHASARACAQTHSHEPVRDCIRVVRVRAWCGFSACTCTAGGDGGGGPRAQLTNLRGELAPISACGTECGRARLRGDHPVRHGETRPTLLGV